MSALILRSEGDLLMILRDLAASSGNSEVVRCGPTTRYGVVRCETKKIPDGVVYYRAGSLLAPSTCSFGVD